MLMPHPSRATDPSGTQGRSRAQAAGAGRAARRSAGACRTHAFLLMSRWVRSCASNKLTGTVPVKLFWPRPRDTKRPQSCSEWCIYAWHLERGRNAGPLTSQSSPPFHAQLAGGRAPRADDAPKCTHPCCWELPGERVGAEIQQLQVAALRHRRRRAAQVVAAQVQHPQLRALAADFQGDGAADGVGLRAREVEGQPCCGADLSSWLVTACASAARNIRVCRD